MTVPRKLMPLMVALLFAVPGALSAYSVDFVNKDYGRSVLLSFCEYLSQVLLRLTIEF